MITLAKWSVQEYHQIIETGILGSRRVELLEGKIIEIPPEGPLHRSKCDSIAEYFREILRERAKIYESHPVTLPDSEPEPDIAIVRLPTSRYDTRHPHPDDIYWLIEISDKTLTKDLGVKRVAYARASILEYWVIDVEAKQLTVFQHPLADDYQTQKIYIQGTISPLAFPDLQVLITKLVN